MTTRPQDASPDGAAWHVDDLPWEPTAGDGTRYALLEGDRQLHGGAFTYAFFLPRGFWDPPHWHTQDARVVVVHGELRFRYGDRFDPDRAVAHPAGSVLLVPALARHFDGAEEDTVIIGVGRGVWNTHYVDPKHGGSAGTPAARVDRAGATEWKR